MRFSKRLPNDTSTLLLLATFIIVVLGLSASVGDRASTHAVEISAFGAVVLLAVYAVWLSSYLRGNGPVTPPSNGHEGLAMRLAVGPLAVAGIGAALVSDWFVASVSPAAETLGISKESLASSSWRSRQRRRERDRHRPRRQGKEQACSLRRQELRRPDRGVPLSGAGPVVAVFTDRLTFVLSPVYIGAPALTALAVWQVTGDGEATQFEGAAPVGIYLILAFLTVYE